MKVGRNQLCPCGSGLKLKRCCRIPSPVIENVRLVVPASVVDSVVATIAAISDEDLVGRLEGLARTQPDLCAFISPLSNSLPQEAAYPAALATFAIVWMFEKHHQRCLPQVSTAQIDRCLYGNGESFLDFDDIRDRRDAMSGKAQPFIHKYIADTIFDFDRSDYDSDGFDLFRFFMLLKTTVNVLHEVTSKAVMEQPLPALSAAANSPTSNSQISPFSRF